MSIFTTALKSLTSIFTRDDLGESLNATREAITKHTLPHVQQAHTLWGKTKFKDSDVNALVNGYRRNNGSRPIFEAIAAGLANALEQIDIVEKLAAEKLTDTEAVTAITYSKSSLLQLACAYEFYSVYTRRLLNFVYYREAQGYIEEAIEGPKKVCVDWLFSCSEAYWEILKLVSLKPAELEKKIRLIPDTIISEDTTNVLSSLHGVQVMDPLMLNALSNYINPFYAIHRHIAGYQAKKYKEIKEEAQLLELRFLQTRKLMDSTQDPKLQGEIDMLQDRLTKTRANLAELEEKYGL